MKWISVKDRLPEYNKNVLVCFITPVWKELAHSVASVSSVTRHAGKDTPYDNRWWIYSSRCEIKPTHWMELPKLPKL